MSYVHPAEVDAITPESIEWLTQLIGLTFAAAYERTQPWSGMQPPWPPE